MTDQEFYKKHGLDLICSSDLLCKNIPAKFKLADFPANDSKLVNLVLNVGLKRPIFTLADPDEVA